MSPVAPRYMSGAPSARPRRKPQRPGASKREKFEREYELFLLKGWFQWHAEHTWTTNARGRLVLRRYNGQERIDGPEYVLVRALNTEIVANCGIYGSKLVGSPIASPSRVPHGARRASEIRRERLIDEMLEVEEQRAFEGEVQQVRDALDQAFRRRVAPKPRRSTHSSTQHSRANKRETAAARRRSVELATWIVEHPPLWPMSVEDWQTPAARAERARGRPPTRRSKVEQMLQIRAVLYKRIVKRSAVAKAAVGKAAAARRKAGDAMRDRVLAEAATLRQMKCPDREFAARIAAKLGAIDGKSHDTKHIRRILKTAENVPETHFSSRRIHPFAA